MNGLDVVGFGALNLDQLYMVNKIAKEEDESYILGLKESFGGSASNTIIGLSRLGLKTGFIGKVSKDSAGKLLLENLKKEGVDTTGVIVSEKGKSGKVLGFVDRKGQRALYVDPGVNDMIKIDEIHKDYLSTLNVLHLSSFVGGSKEAQERLLNEIPGDIIVSLDPGKIYAERGMVYLKNILKHTNIILLNQKELKQLTEKEYKTFEEKEHKILEEKTKILLDHVDIVVVKRGDKGCYVTDGRESHFIKSFKTKCVDTTGAGDAFIGAFAFYYGKSKNLRDSVKFANVAAGLSVTKIGTQTSFPELSDIETALKIFKN